jgi:hypothetical protein
MARLAGAGAIIPSMGLFLARRWLHLQANVINLEKSVRYDIFAHHPCYVVTGPVSAHAQNRNRSDYDYFLYLYETITGLLL